jgi:hypothetical protein
LINQGRKLAHATRQIVFSAPRPLGRQSTAAWLAAFSVTALLGAGAALRWVLAGGRSLHPLAVARLGRINWKR